MKDKTFELFPVTSEEMLRLCLKIRNDVFVVEKKVPVELDVDEFDDLGTGCDHFIASVNGRYVGTLRCELVSDDTVHVQRFCILSGYRGIGLGTYMLGEIEKLYADKGIKSVELNAKCEASGFYEKMGYKQISDVFLDAGVDHITMMKTI